MTGVQTCALPIYLGEFTGFTQRSGFCEYPLYLFNVDKLRELCPDGMDKYEATETEVVNPYDNSIKTQGTEKELTLFTCSQKGTMRFVVRCIYKEAVMDE